MENKINVLIVDDEFHARKLLADYVSKVPFLHLVKTCMNVFEAIEMMQKEHIDLLMHSRQAKLVKASNTFNIKHLPWFYTSHEQHSFPI